MWSFMLQKAVYYFDIQIDTLVLYFFEITLSSWVFLTVIEEQHSHTNLTVTENWTALLASLGIS